MSNIIGQTKLKNVDVGIPMPIKEFIDFAISVAESLIETHKNHFHGAICPENIIWDSKNSKAHLADLSDRNKNTLFNIAQLPYISPEQTGRMNLKVDYRTDLYSLGIVFYEMLVGEPPFIADDNLEVIHLHIASMPTQPHIKRVEVPEQLSNIIFRLLQKNPDDRYQSAYGLKYDLESCAKQWKQNASIQPFDLGKSDLKGVFRIPQKFYGREKELTALLESFNRICREGQELIIVAGYSGVGKSALVHQVQRMITQRGFFIEGKFDQYQSNLPYFAWQQAFSILVNNLLMENDDKLAIWKKRIQKAVGHNGKVLTNIIPNLELIIGPQPEVPLLGGIETENRFDSVFQNFVKAIADKEHPLVIFLDDLQWIDSASLNLLQKLVTDPGLSHLQYIIAYRDNEVDAEHPLIPFQKHLNDELVVMKKITLQNLEKKDVIALTADTLQSTYEIVFPIAELIYSKTAGNVFFSRQVLQNLKDENLLSFDSTDGYWKWDIETIRSLEISENVIEVISRRMRKLPVPTQNILKIASCIGNQFDIETLSLITQQEPNDINGIIERVLQEDVILPLNDRYKFAHDRIQQAAYSLIPEEVKNKTHLEIGWILLEQIPKVEREERIFDIVNHLNMGAMLLTRSSERIQLAELNLIAGIRAKLSTAYESALEYFGIGIELLGENAWNNNYNLCLDFFTEAVEAASLSGDYEKMEELSHAVLSFGKTIGDKIRVIDIKIAHETTQMNHETAINIGLKYLSELGLELKTKISKEEVSLALKGTIELLGKQTADKLINLDKDVEPKLEYQVHIINSLLTPNYFSNQNLLVLSICMSLDILINNGNTSDSALSYAYGSLILSNLAIRQYKIGHLAGQVAMSMIEKHSNDPQECPVIVITHGYIFQYRIPIKKNIQKLFKAFQIGVDNGNLEYASYAIAKATMSLLCSGEKLEQLIDVTQNYTPFLKNHCLLNCFFTNCMIIAISKYLRNPLNYSYYPEKYWQLKQEVAGDMGESQDDIHRFYDYHALQTISIHFGHYSEALEIGKKAHKCVSSLYACYPAPPFYFYDTLACLKMTESTSEDQKELLSKRINRNMELLTEWCEIAPFNFEHMYQLSRAEQARIQNSETASSFYEQAIKAAKKHGFKQDLALCYNMAANYYKQSGFEEFFKIYKLKAHESYKKWGALALVQHLEKQDPSLFTSIPPTISDRGQPLQLDLSSVIKASQAIAGEIKLDKLLSKMMQIIIENAGAQNGAIILAQGNEWTIEASMDVEKGKMIVLQSLRIEENNTVSAGIIQYVSRTQETLVLSDAANEGDFTNDLDIQNRRSRSVLCTPLINQGIMRGILYLENNLIAGAFTTSRVELLKLLLSEMVMALVNAQVYHDLEQSEKRFRATFEQAAVGIAHVSPEGKFLRINQKYCDIVGYSRKELLQHNFRDITYSADLESDVAQVNKLLAGEINTYSMAKRYICKGGELVWVDLTVSLVRNEMNQPQWFVAVVTNINERMRATRELHKSEKKNRELVDHLNTVFESSPVAEVIVDKTGCITLVNKEAEKIFGYNRDEMVGELVELLIPGRFHANHSNYREDFYAKQQRRSMGPEQSLYARRKDGKEFPIEVALSPMRIKGEKMVLSAIIDISDRKLALENTLKYQRRLKDLAHEITITEEVIRKQVAVDLHDHVGQLLASTRMQLSKINKIEENPAIIARVENISQSLRGAIQAIRDAIFNLSPPQLNEIGLYPAVDDWMKNQIESKHGILTSISGEDENLPIDVNTRYLLFRSIRELMHNVVKHAQATKLDVNFCINNESIEITVRDNGRGFDYNPDQLRLKSDSYGLFSIDERLKDLDGSLEVNSIIGKGSNIKLTIPIKEE